MYAQRFGDRPNQDAMGFTALGPEDLANKISEHVAKYFVKVVSVTAYSDSWGHHAIVVFEREG